VHLELLESAKNPSGQEARQESLKKNVPILHEVHCWGDIPVQVAQIEKQGSHFEVIEEAKVDEGQLVKQVSVEESK
jgi:hypothetical protein